MYSGWWLFRRNQESLAIIDLGNVLMSSRCPDWVSLHSSRVHDLLQGYETNLHHGLQAREQFDLFDPIEFITLISTKILCFVFLNFKLKLALNK